MVKWAVLYFSKILFILEGVDMICKKGSLPSEMWEQIRLKRSVDPLSAKHLPEIKVIRTSNNSGP
jgi:hypothetical protein